MSRLRVFLCFCTALLSTVLNADVQQSAQELFKKLSMLDGDWTLSPAAQQQGGATQNKLVKPLVGTGSVAMSFRLIGNGTTIQENLLPGNAKEMATMYRCDKANNCTRLLATHYCAKKNQPELVADTGSGDRMIRFNCDMNTELCNSNEGHVHGITHELIGENHLKTTYTIFKNGKFEKDSVYHFDRAPSEAANMAALEMAEKRPDCKQKDDGQANGKAEAY